MGYVDLFKEPVGHWSRSRRRILARSRWAIPTADSRHHVLDDASTSPATARTPTPRSPTSAGPITSRSTARPRSPAELAPDLHRPEPDLQRLDERDHRRPRGPPTTSRHSSILDFTDTKDPDSAPAPGSRNAHLIQPGYAANTTQIFTNDFLDALKPFGTLRYLTPTTANDSGRNQLRRPLNWSQRRLPDEASQTDNSYGQYGDHGNTWSRWPTRRTPTCGSTSPARPPTTTSPSWPI